MRFRLSFAGEKGEFARENLTIFSAVTLTYTGFATSFPFIVLFLLHVKDVPLSQVGLVYLISGIVGLLGQWVGGRITDFLGTRTMTIVGLAGSVAMYGLLAIFVIKDTPVLWYIVVYPILNLFNNLSQLALSSHVSDRSRDAMASGMSLLYVGLNLGFTIGPISGGILVAEYGYWSIFVFGAASTFVSTIVAMVGLKSNPRYALRSVTPTAAGKPNLRLERGLFTFFVLVMVSWLSIGYQAIPLSVFESNFLSLSSVQIGIVLTTNGLLITILQMPVSRKIGIEHKMRLLPIALGSFLMAAGFIAIALSHGIYLLEAGIVLTTLGEIMVAVPTQVVSSLFSREHNRGKYQGYYFAFSRTGIALSSYIGPLIFSIFVLQAYLGWYIIALVTIISGVAYYLLSPAIQRIYAELPQ